jgi:hypothetical protein
MPRRGKSYADRNITELKASHRGRSPGWCVRFRVDGVSLVQTNFSNLKYGGSPAALIAAQRFRDAIEREIEFEISNVGASFDKLTKRNKTGIVGVSRIDRKYIDGRWGTNCHKLVWEARWPDKDHEGRQKIQQFSIKTLGEEKAKELAIAAREKGLLEYIEQFSQTFRPPKLSTKFWRYMDFTKFVSMLEKDKLFFAFADRMNDSFEGGYSRGNEELREQVNKALGPFEITAKETQRRRESTALSCWHANQHESAAMWQLYSSANESICIQTTFKQLRSCMPRGVDIGEVQYVDYETEWVPERHPILPFLYKRKTFDHEREYRAVCAVSQMNGFESSDFEITDSGGVVDARPAEVVQRIIVAPHVRPWFRELVEQVVSRYELGIPVEPSTLEIRPTH